jgi:creatinine amidohydrolase
MLLQLSTWQEVDEYVRTSKGIIIPIGSTEQHGPNGFLGTDALCPEIVARGIAEKIDVLIAPTLGIGMAQHHLGFSGSITLRLSTLMAVVADVVNSLSHHGFERCYFLNGHGGNIATLSAAFSEVYARSSLATPGSNHSSVRCKLGNWFASERVRKLSDELYRDEEGSHATPSEVSLTYYAYPENIKHVDMSPRVAPRGTFYDATHYRATFPDGRIASNPALANSQDSERLFHAAVKEAIT